MLFSYLFSFHLLFLYYACVYNFYCYNSNHLCNIFNAGAMSNDFSDVIKCIGGDVEQYAHARKRHDCDASIAIFSSFPSSARLKTV